MTDDKMIRMANQIATFFNSQPGDGAPAAIAAHISDFWDPRMRAQLTQYVAGGGEGLDENVIRAEAILSPAT